MPEKKYKMYKKYKKYKNENPGEKTNLLTLNILKDYRNHILQISKPMQIVHNMMQRRKTLHMVPTDYQHHAQLRDHSHHASMMQTTSRSLKQSRTINSSIH